MDNLNKKIIDDKTKEEILENVLESDDFRKAKKFQELLRYLATVTMQGESIKESTIAYEFFGKEAAFDPSQDSIVRAYVSNLRKKLEHYYLTDGQNDDIHLVLPKGEYYVEFVPVEKEKITPQKRYRKVSSFMFIPLIAVLFLVIIFMGIERISFERRESKYIPEKDFIWGDIFESDQKTLIVLGDYYFFSMPIDSGRHSYIRDVKINSDEELEAFLAKNPQYKGAAAKTYHTYLDEHLPWAISSILPSFVFHNVEFELRLSSELQLDDLKKYNIIYIGPYKCLNVMRAVTRNLDFKYSLGYNSHIEFFDHSAKKLFTYSWVLNPQTRARNDYALVIKVSGGNNNTLMFFISENDFGNISTVKHFTNPIFLRDMKSKINSQYFEALFEVKGIVRTDFEIKLLHVNPLGSNFEITLK